LFRRRSNGALAARAKNPLTANARLELFLPPTLTKLPILDPTVAGGRVSGGVVLSGVVGATVVEGHISGLLSQVFIGDEVVELDVVDDVELLVVELDVVELLVEEVDDVDDVELLLVGCVVGVVSGGVQSTAAILAARSAFA